jgi:prepilin-type N-terminal cleavage/methylation domain-containing protein
MLFDRLLWGFTLTELLVSMSVITILALLLVPAIAYGRSLARDASCKGQLRQLWTATNYYANSHKGMLFVNYAPPLRISNVLYKDGHRSGWGILHPRYLSNYRVSFCPSDPGRGPAWEYGWSNWGSAAPAEVQGSYGYRGRQGLVKSSRTALTLSVLEHHPTKIIGCDFYEPFFDPPRVHHKNHINTLRCNGRVDQTDKLVAFGPTVADLWKAVAQLDR